MSGQPHIVHSLGATSEDLRIHLLGPPCVEWNDRPLSIPRRQTRALLYRLAVRPEPVPREQLCFLFWSDIPETTARRNLSHLLTHLRRALPAPEVLLTPEDHVALDPQRVWSDTAAFERLCATTEETGFLEALQQAVALYRGPFLAGFSLPTSPEFDTWSAQERRVWERLYLEALATLVETETAHGNYDAAIAYAQRYLETDELAEEMHRRLIQLYAANGDRSAALRQFECCTAILERELGVRPLPETRAVYQAVLESRPPSLQPPETQLTWATLPGLDAPLVGREAALHHLEQAYAQARTGHGRMVLISGEAGIGKSRLMQDFATRLQNQALILTGASHPGSQTLPYHPIVQAQRATGGNPFFLLETLRVLLESGQPLEKLASLKNLPLPDTVREALQVRIERLRPKARQVLEAGAVLGATFDFDLVRLTAGRGELETVDGLDELVARQLLVQQGTGYRFHHDLTRRAVEAGLSPVRRQLLHRRAGRALEQLEPDAVAALAHHFDAGGEGKKALHYHGLAAQRAEALFAWREAEEHQTRMLELLDQLDPERSAPDCLTQRGQVLADRAHLRFLQGRLEERDADLAALGDLAEARRWFQRAVERARSIAHRRHIAVALIGLGLVEIAEGQLAAAHRRLREAVAVARESECWENVAAGLAALARTERQQGDAASALTHAREAVRVARKIGLPACKMWGEVEVGLALLAADDPAAALEHTERAVALVPQADESWIGTEEAHLAHAQVLQALGCPEEAEAHARRAARIIQTKAARIGDADLRQRYLEFHAGL